MLASHSQARKAQELPIGIKCAQEAHRGQRGMKWPRRPLGSGPGFKSAQVATMTALVGIVTPFFKICRNGLVPNVKLTSAISLCLQDRDYVPTPSPYMDYYGLLHGLIYYSGL